MTVSLANANFRIAVVWCECISGKQSEAIRDVGVRPELLAVCENSPTHVSATSERTDLAGVAILSGMAIAQAASSTKC